MGSAIDRAVVITGASSGIGYATAVHLDRLGFRVFATVRRDADAEALRRHCSERVVSLRADVTDHDSVAAVANIVAAKLDGIGLYGLVNNAGIGVAGALEFLPIQDIRAQFEVNVIGVAAVTKTFLPQIRRSGGRIVTIGSVGGRLAMPLLGAYCASKAALAAFTDSLRLELQQWNVHVSLIEPGIIATPIFDRVQAGADVLLREIPEDIRKLYDPMIEAFRNATAAHVKSASPPEVVARAVGDALTANTPKARYVVGRNGRVEALIAGFLPARMRDFVLSQALGLPKKV